MRNKKTAIVVQRYGKEVNGGAEFHARLIAGKLKTEGYDVEVLTSTALGYSTWLSHYPTGESEEDGIKIHRFFSFERNPIKSRLGKTIQKCLKIVFGKSKILQSSRLTQFQRFFAIPWLEGQGPYMPSLTKYIALNRAHYDVFIFFTYLYYPTHAGLPLVAHKSIFIPTAHDEKELYFPINHLLFTYPRYILYNSLAEKNLVEQTFKNHHTNNRITGVGIDALAMFEGSANKLFEKYNISKRYIIYIGRIDANKGCGIFDSNTTWSILEQHNLELVLVGQNHLQTTINHPNVIYTGFIPDEEKNSLLSHSLGLILPSPYESLSIVTLEALSLGIPVIANGDCKVLKAHIEESKAGWLYYDKDSYKNAIKTLVVTSSENRKIIRKSGIDYINKNYNWEIVLNKYKKAIALISNLHIINHANKKNVFSSLLAHTDILFLFNKCCNFGGGEVVAYNIASCFKDKNLSFIFQDSRVEEEMLARYNTLGKVFVFTTNSNKRDLKKYLSTLASKMQTVPKKLIVFNNDSTLLYQLLKYTKSNNPNVISIDLIHAFAKGSFQEISLPVAKKISKRVVLGNYHYNAFAKLYKKNELVGQERKVHIIPNFVKTPKQQVTKSYSSKLKILYSGRGHAEKRIHIFIDIAKRCRNKNLEVEFLTMGALEEFKTDFKKVGIQHLGYITNDREMLMKHYEEAHCLILCSSYEGMPIVILEAMSVGTVPMSTAVGDIADIIEDGKNGFLIQNDSEQTIVTQFVERIEWVLKNKAQLKDMSVASYHTVKEKFNPPMFRKNYRKLFEMNKEHASD